MRRQREDKGRECQAGRAPNLAFGACSLSCVVASPIVGSVASLVLTDRWLGFVALGPDACRQGGRGHMASRYRDALRWSAGSSRVSGFCDLSRRSTWLDRHDVFAAANGSRMSSCALGGPLDRIVIRCRALLCLEAPFHVVVGDVDELSQSRIIVLLAGPELDVPHEPAGTFQQAVCIGEFCTAEEPDVHVTPERIDVAERGICQCMPWDDRRATAPGRRLRNCA